MAKLRILVIGDFGVEAFALHISETLDTMGHMVLRFQAAPRARTNSDMMRYRISQARRHVWETLLQIPRMRRVRMRRLWSLVDGIEIDVVIVTHDMYLWPGEVSDIKERTGALVCLWFPDSIAGFGRAYFMNAPYDALFFKDPYVVRALRRTLDLPVYYLPECFNPTRHRLSVDDRDADKQFACDITTAGSLHSYRVAFFRQMGEYDIKLWGTPPPLWLSESAEHVPYMGMYVADSQKATAFRRARIVINNLHPSEIWGINARTFEICGVGAFQLVDWRPGLGQLFDIGRELQAFSDMDDLKRKVDFYLENDDLRSQIARAGMVRAMRDHTYEKRLSMLLGTVLGEQEGYPMPNLTPHR